MLASYLAEFVALTLRAARTFQGAPLTDEENSHLLGANYWVQPIYQDLLHAASGHTVTRVYREKASDLAVGCLKLWLSRDKSDPGSIDRDRQKAAEARRTFSARCTQTA